MTDSDFHKFERLIPDDDKQATSLGCMKSIEGYILCVTNLHQEAAEEDLMEAFSEFGSVGQIHMNTDRQTRYVKGYALLEFSQLSQAELAI